MKTNEWFTADWVGLLFAFILTLIFGTLDTGGVIRMTLACIVLMLIEYKLWPGNFIKNKPK